MDNKNIIIRPANLSDIDQLTNLYMALSDSTRRYFHPFPFNTRKVKAIFWMIVISSKLIRILQIITPKLGFLSLVAYDTTSSTIVGFVYLHILGRKNDKFVANLGIVVKEGSRSQGVGSDMLKAIIQSGRKNRIETLRLTVIESNAIAIRLYEKMGFIFKSYTTNDSWQGRKEKNILMELLIPRS